MSEKHKRGVSLDFLLQFVREFGVSKDMMTWQVCDTIIKPHTEKHRCCYFDMLQNATGAQGLPWASKQTVFLPHSWGKTFVSLVETAKEHDRVDGVKHYYYIDLFGLNQHDLAEIGAATTATTADELSVPVPLGTQTRTQNRRPSVSDAGSFCALPGTTAAKATAGPAAMAVGDKTSTPTCDGQTSDGGAKEDIAAHLLETLDMCIATADTTLVAIDTWKDPAPLSRIWCLYQMWRTMHFGRRLVMGFSREAAVDFVKAVRSMEVDVDDLVEKSADIRKAQATVEADLIMITKKVAVELGIDKFNEEVREKLLAHFAHTAAYTKISK